MAVDDPVIVETKQITVTYTEWGEYHYFASFAVSFGYRPVETTDTSLAINKIWANGELWFDRNISEIKPGLKFYFLPGTSDQMPPPGVEIAYRDQIVLWFDNVDLGTDGQLPTISVEFIDENDITVADALQKIAERAGYADDKIVISPSLAEIDMLGYILNGQASLESVATDLGFLYDFNYVESNGEVHFVQNYEDGAYVVTFDVGDGLAVLREGGNAGQQIDSIAVASEQSLPSSITATYFDVDDNYQQGSQTASKREVYGKQSSVSFSLPVIMHGNEMRSRLFDALARSYDEANGHAVRLPPEFMQTEAGDAISFIVYGTTYYATVMQATLNGDWSVSVSLSERGADRSGNSVDTQPPSTTVHTINPKSIRTIIMDIPDTDPGQYVDGFLNYRVALGSDVLGAWRGGRFDLAPVDNMDSWVPVFVSGLHDEAGIGIVTALTDPDTIKFDMKNFTQAHLVANTDGLMVIGSQGRYEIIRYHNISFSHGIATITDLERGLYGTDDWITRHSVGDTVVLYADTVEVRYTLDDYRSDRQFVYRGVAAYQKIENAPTSLYVPSGNSRKPYSPNDVAITTEENGDIIISWTKDTSRHIVYGFDEETVEAYSLDIFNTDWHAVRRVIGVAGLEYVYTAQNQVLDNFILADDLQILVYQLSPVVGQGFPGGGTRPVAPFGILSVVIGGVRGFHLEGPLATRFGPIESAFVTDLLAGRPLYRLAAHIGGVAGMPSPVLRHSPYRVLIGTVRGVSGGLAAIPRVVVRSRKAGIVAGDDDNDIIVSLGAVVDGDVVVIHDFALGPADHVFTDRPGFDILGTIDNRAINQQWGRFYALRITSPDPSFEIDFGSYTATHQLQWFATQAFVLKGTNADIDLTFAMSSIATPLDHLIVVDGSTHHRAPSVAGLGGELVLGMVGAAGQRSYVAPVGMFDLGFVTSHNDDYAPEYGGDFGATLAAAYSILLTTGPTGVRDFTYATFADYISGTITAAFDFAEDMDVTIAGTLHAVTAAISIDLRRRLTVIGNLGHVTGSASIEIGQHVTAVGTLGRVTASVSMTVSSPAHRFWRLDIAGVNGDPDDITLLYYIGLFAGVTEVSNNTMDAQASSSYFGAPGDEVLFNPVNPLTTIANFGWASGGGLAGHSMPQFWDIDLGVGNDQEVDGLILRPQTVNRSPSAFTLSYSDDRSSWTVKGSYTTATGWTANTDRTFTVP